MIKGYGNSLISAIPVDIFVLYNIWIFVLFLTPFSGTMGCRCAFAQQFAYNRCKIVAGWDCSNRALNCVARHPATLSASGVANNFKGTKNWMGAEKSLKFHMNIWAKFLIFIFLNHNFWRLACQYQKFKFIKVFFITSISRANSPRILANCSPFWFIFRPNISSIGWGYSRLVVLFSSILSWLNPRGASPCSVVVFYFGPTNVPFCPFPQNKQTNLMDLITPLGVFRWPSSTLTESTYSLYSRKSTVLIGWPCFGAVSWCDVVEWNEMALLCFRWIESFSQN